MNIQKVTSQVGSKKIEIETGKMGGLADGAVTVRCGDTMVFISAVSATKIKPGQSFFPLSVEYKEKAAAAGMFPGGYTKREGRPTEKEILTCRMTDRSLRPLFPKGYLYDTQIVALLLSADGENDADILAMNGASAALSISDVPFAGPIGAVRVGRVDGEFIANPTHSEQEESDLDLIYVGTETEVAMIEGAADQLPEADFIAALEFGQKAIQPLIEVQKELKKLAGKETREYKLSVPKEELLEIGYSIAGDRIEDAIYAASKIERSKKVGALRDEVEEAIKAKYPEVTEFEIEETFEYIQKKAFRISIMEKGLRADGRQVEDLRPLFGEINSVPKVHGSAIFARGETMSLGLATLASTDETQYFDSYSGGVDSKRFILHYNFPPFSVGEAGRFGGFNRREIGHGALAERSILPVIPCEKEFPYAMRVSSEIMESNGSTSMATVCSGVMSLMNAGVPLTAGVGGISVGMVTESTDSEKISNYKLLLDIIGSEDFYGDMDFKLCGTREGVTGYQLDLKLAGIPLNILIDAVKLAFRKGLPAIIDKMESIIPETTGLSDEAPRIESISIKPDKIGELIGPGGKNIKGIQAESGADVSISDDGTVSIYAAKPEQLERAKQLIMRMFEEVEPGKIYEGKIVSTTNFGAFMSVLPGKDGLIHISQLADKRVENTEDVVKVGDIVKAKCIGFDDRGRIKMSIKAAAKEVGAPAKEISASAEDAAESAMLKAAE